MLRLIGFLFVSWCLVGAQASAVSGDQSSLCGKTKSYVVSEADVVVGKAALTQNESGDFVLAVDQADSRAGLRVFRFVAEQPEKLTGLLEHFNNNGSEFVVTQFKSPALTRLVVEVGSDAEQAWEFRLDKGGCGPVAEKIIGLKAQQVFHLKALANLRSGGTFDQTEVSLLDSLSTKSIIAPGDSDLQLSVGSAVGGSELSAFYCTAGGPGSTACSISFGGIGPIETGSCSIECAPPFYACCGLGIRNCVCRLQSNGGGPGGPLPGGPGGPGGPGDDDDDEGDDEVN